MRLADAARFFDRTVCVDAYNAGESFKGQLDLFDDSMRDGTTVVRRVLSVAEGVVIPARRAIVVHGETFVVGSNHTDSFNGGVVRRKYILHRAEGLASVKTADQALRTLAGTDMYASRLWVKDLRELETSSRLSSFLNVYVAPSEVVAAGRLLYLSGRWHIVRNSFLGAAGFRICEADELPEDALGSGSYTSKSGSLYDPANDTITGGAGTIPILQHRWQDDYHYLRMSAERFDDGDIVAHVSKANVATAIAGDAFTFGGVNYQVLSAQDDGANAWALHARRD